MNFINKIIELAASFVSTKFVLYNGDIGWISWLIINH